MRNFLLLLLFISTGVSLIIISKHYEPVLQFKTYKVIANYQRGTKLNSKIWARNIKNTQTEKVFVENNISFADTLNFPSGSEMHHALFEDQSFGEKLQYAGAKIIQIFGIIFISLSVLSFFGFLRQYKNSKKTKTEESFEDESLFEELECSYCHKEIKKTDASFTNDFSMRYHQKCWDEFSNDK